MDDHSSITSFDESGIHGFLHHPASPSGNGLVLTHGAGANCQSPLLVALAAEFCSHGLTVLRYDLPFRQARPHGPPMRGSSEKDQAGIALAIAALKKVAAGPIYAGGHSYGGRQTTLLAACQTELIDGLLLLSYPLHPPKAPTQLRTAHFPDLQTPALFVHGTRDGFGTLADMAEALKLIPARTKLMPIEAAGHELLSKRNQDVLPRTIAEAFFEMFPN